MDISGEDDYRVIKTDRLQVEDGVHVLHPKQFEGYENLPMPEPVRTNPDPCNVDWIPPDRPPIPFGSQRVIIGPNRRVGYVEFYYKKVAK